MKWIEEAAEAIGAPLDRLDRPMKWSEDFGAISSRYAGAMFGLGSGVDTPQLHNPNFDFPDSLIEVGARMFAHLIARASLLLDEQESVQNEDPKPAPSPHAWRKRKQCDGHCSQEE